MLLAIALVSGLAAGSCQQTLAVTIDTGQSVKLDDGRELRLALVSYPVILYGENATISFQFRLFQGNTNQTIPHVTYYVELADATKEDDEPLLQELFHSHGGPLVLKINPDNSQFVTIRGQRDLIYNAWLAGNHTNTVNIDAPAKTFDTGLFKVHADAIGIDRDGHAFEEDDIPAFDVYLSIGRALTRQVSFMDNSYDIAIISYYDKIQEFKFNADRREFYWSMPFNWDLTHLNNTKNLFIHQDIRVPKSLIQLSLNGSDPANDVIMNATVNGFLLHGSQFVIDPYSSENEYIIHYLLSKNDIISMAKQLQNQSDSINDEMTFTLSRSTAVVPEFGSLAILVMSIGIAAGIASISAVSRKRAFSFDRA